MRVHEQDARRFKFSNLVWLFLHLTLHFKISEIHSKFVMIIYLWDEPIRYPPSVGMKASTLKL
jgi:hydroxyacyl-ACP dehydratase HTD2-like protein with hotdog domain